MKNRCYKQKISSKVELAIKGLNLTDEDCDSGALEYLRLNSGVSVEGGYVVKAFGEQVAWGAAFSNNEFHIYVSPFARRHGIAKKIIKRSKKDFPGYHFCPWDQKGLLLFKSTKSKYVKGYLPWSLMSAA